ncbi:hypothetical protein [Sphingomonas montanisoli]|uniref:STAS/SEC14 domain-containing protein n=1 Tax=Sphingomonas montanisoli TaxID=2606412 RepID=A0A5D9C8A2_9SPHN|nr:hypothetical protein [Sphingomonas montanisoli]TZG27583.1 hypothetical protein FYJ91_08335 [Sphingomonas montanisoli]
MRFPTRQRLLLTLSGLLPVNEFLDLRDRLAAERASLGEGKFDLLIDATRSSMPPQAIVALAQHIFSGPYRYTRRVAVGVGASLSRMQGRRGETADTQRVFPTVVEAEAWLDAELGLRPHAGMSLAGTTR